MLIRTFGNKIVEICREDFLNDELFYKEIMILKGLVQNNKNDNKNTSKNNRPKVLKDIVDYLLE